MVQKHLASLLLGLGALSPFVVQADQPSKQGYNGQKGMMMDRQNMKNGPTWEPGEEISQNDPKMGDNMVMGYVPAAYNYPAQYSLGDHAWDVWLTGSFTYWEAKQENMVIGFKANQLPPVDAGTLVGSEVDILLQKTKYEPGFKVGIGMGTTDWDAWSLYAQYTWFHPGNETDSEDQDGCGSCVNNTILLYPACCGSLTEDPAIASSVTSMWKLDMDVLDLQVQRPYYMGKRIIINPLFGLRAAWIKQKFSLEYDVITNSSPSTPVGEFEQTSRSKSWSLGPRVGMEGNWLLGYGLRVIGNAYASILYTSYTNIELESNFNLGTETLNAGGGTTEWEYKKNYNILRPNAEIDAGLGWGWYFGRDFHLDLAATYDFQIWWDQDMVENINNIVQQRTSASPGDLTIRGLTVTARFDF